MHSMKRQCVLCLLMLFVSMWINAQNLSVKSFRLLETDLTANLEGTKEIDQNGEVAALIKIETNQTGFIFDGGSLGIVDTKLCKLCTNIEVRHLCKSRI